jgi:ribonuclease HI
VGNGASIDVWNQNWIPRSSLQRAFGHKPNQEVQKVQELLLPGGTGWNITKLNEVFFEEDVADILKIPVGRAGTDDYVAWNYTKSGFFSVRSAYHLKQHLKQMAAGRGSSSLSCSEHRGWLSLWAANVPGKAKVHCWRLVKNGLAVGDELRRRNIKAGVVCVACNRAETIHHRFWACPHSVRIWELLKERSGLRLAAPPRDCRSHGELQTWLLDWLAGLKEKELALAMMALYHMWLARNDARDEPMIEDPDRTARRILGLLDEWRALKPSSGQQSHPEVEHWLPPEVGWHKANADGALSPGEGTGGVGVIIRDHHGDALLGACHFFPRETDPERVELLACKHAVQAAQQLGTRRLVLETDCAGVVSKLRKEELDRSVHGPLVEEIKVLIGEFEDSMIKHVRRSGNGVAHKLAKEGCINKLCNTWVSSYPDYVLDVLARDIG